LAAKIWTRDIDAAHHLTSQLKAGTIEINGSGGPDANLPFGGVKQSGWGRELGPEGLDQFLELKTVRIWHDLSRFSGPDRDIV
jgi:acyl-CoA reductase-like NAD-dependent aldehyde dehydrogenase